jgi:hypothetical protein
LGQVDSRPLSLFRICFATLLLKNALYFIPLAHLFYSDAGIVPRAQFWENPAGAGLAYLSLMNYFSESWMAILFFGLWAGVCLALLVGYRTRLMVVLTYLIHLSITNRNPLILTGADRVMTVLSFWMIFLPLHHHYSVDNWLARRARLQPGRGETGAEQPATTYVFPLRVIQIQIAVIYLLTSYYKWQGALWREGDALFYTFQQEGYLLPTGVWLSQVAPLWVFRLLTWLTLVVEAAFAPLVFFPVLQPWARAIGLLLVALMHLGIAVTMGIPDFSLVMWISYILFFEPSWVVWLEQRVRQFLNLPLTARVCTPPVAVDRALPRLPVSLEQGVLTLALAALLGVTIWGGVGGNRDVWDRLAYTTPKFVQAINYHLRLSSQWQMFVYGAIPRSGWVVIHGQFEQGATSLLYTSADPLTGQMYRQWGPGARLRLFEQHLSTSFPNTILRAWGSYYCRLYNVEQGRPLGQRLATLEIHLRYRLSYRPGAPPNPVEDDLLWRHYCLSS